METLEKTDVLIKKMREQLIPETMGELQLKSIEMDTGLRVVVTEVIHASLPSTKSPVKRQRALEIVRASGNEGLIKTTFHVSYSRDASTHVDRFKRVLQESGIADYAQVSLDETIHHSTYKKLVRDLADADPGIDLDELGAYRRRVAEIQ